MVFAPADLLRATGTIACPAFEVSFHVRGDVLMPVRSNVAAWVVLLIAPAVVCAEGPLEGRPELS